MMRSDSADLFLSRRMLHFRPVSAGRMKRVGYGSLSTADSPCYASSRSEVSMNITATCYGTAALHLALEGALGVFFDPYLDRPPEARPRISADARTMDMHPLNAILVSHGHYDHILNLPHLLKRHPSAHAYVPAPVVQTCRRLCQGEIFRAYSCALSEGDWSRMHTLGGGDGCELSAADGRVRIRAEATRSSHVKYDAWSVLRVLLNPRVIRRIGYYAKVQFAFPHRGVLAWALQMEAGGQSRQVVFLGTLPREGPQGLSRYRGCDCLFLPLAGRRDVLPLASAVTSALQPGMVVPIHHDNFMPPISYTVDIRSYREWLAAEFPKTRFLELTPEEPVALFG